MAPCQQTDLGFHWLENNFMDEMTRIVIGVKTSWAFLCFLLIIFLGSFVLTSSLS